MDIKELQAAVNAKFTEAFGPDTPLVTRKRDIKGEAEELERALSSKSLKTELADLLASAIQLANEQEWDIADLIFNVNFPKIDERLKQYQTQGRKTNVAIVGGALDMTTLGHIALASHVLKASRGAFDEVWLMPCYSHAFDKNMAAPEHRMAMAKIAALADRRIRVSDYEVKNQMAGQTIQTVKRLLAEKDYDRYRFAWVIGTDNANTCEAEWTDFDILEQLIRFVVVERQGYPLDKWVNWCLKSPHMYLVTRDGDIPEVCSTDAREALKKKDYDTAAKFIDPAVLEYIKANNLYAS